jgi:hypothetical protein
VATLAAEALDFGHRHALNPDFAEGIPHVIKTKRFYDGGD